MKVLESILNIKSSCSSKNKHSCILIVNYWFDSGDLLLNLVKGDQDSDRISFYLSQGPVTKNMHKYICFNEISETKPYFLIQNSLKQ